MKKERDAYYAGVQADARRIAAEHGLELSTLMEAGHPAQTIVRVANTGSYDLVIMGHTGHASPWGTFLGTTAEKVARHLTCSVLIVC